MSLSNNKTFSNPSTSYQKLSLRLTPLSSNYNHSHNPSAIIRISSKGTPTTTQSSNPPPIYTRITRQEHNPQSLPPKQSTTNLTSSLPKEGFSTSSKLIRSQVVSLTRNWQAQCTSLKQTLDYYKSRIVELQNSKGACNNNRINKEKREVEIYKLRLEQTEQRMNQQNAYLRQCLTKLNTQLQSSNQMIPILENNQQKLESINNSLLAQIKTKSNQLQILQKSYNEIISQVKQQKCVGYNVESKLFDLEQNIKKLEEQNIQLHQQLMESNRIKQNIELQLKEEKFKHQRLVKSYAEMKDEMLEYKRCVNKLQQDINKMRWDNDDLKKVIDDESRKSLLLTKSAYFNESFESSSTKLNNSCLIKSSHKQQGRCLEDKEIKKSYSTILIQQVPVSNQFNIAQYQQKLDEFKLLRMCVDIQRPNIPQNICSLLNLGEYFKQSTTSLFNEKLKLRSTIQKYKKLVDISWQSPNLQHEKSEQFITDLIEKCNLYESSLHEKKNTIDLLQGQLKFLKKQSKELDKKVDSKESKHSSREHKMRFKYLDRQDEYQKQKIIINKLEKQVDTLNLKLCQSTHNKYSYKQKDKDTKKVVSANTSTDSIHPLDKLKSLRPNGASSTTKLLQNHSKLKNISGEQIVKQMQNKLKFYEIQVVPELQAKISQYKGMLDTFQKQYSQSNIEEDRLDQSQVSLVSTNNLLKQSWRRRRRVNTTSFTDFRQSDIKQSKITKPQTSDSNISTQRKKRLDELPPNPNIKVLAAVTLRLCQIAQRMNLNSNYSIILPSSIYLINYSDQYVGSLKVKILQTPKQRLNEVRKYWAPQNLLGYPLGQLSLVWNLGVIIDQTINREPHWKNESEVIDMKNFYKFERSDYVFFKKLLGKMLVKQMDGRISLKEVERIILEQEEYIFN